MATRGAIELKKHLVVIVHPYRYFHIFWLVMVTGPVVQSVASLTADPGS